MFADRSQAGRTLGRMVADQVHDSPLVVLGLPRGGVPVAFEVARCLEATVNFDVFLVRKLGVPDREELAFGAIATGGVRVLNHAIIEQMDLADETIEQVARRQQIELERRERAYRQARPPVDLRDRVVILVDDGLATGATMIAAIDAVRLHEPARIVVAVPVASRQTCDQLRSMADQVICAETHDPFFAVGYWYGDFEQVSDAEVRTLLRQFTPAQSTCGPHEDQAR
jgi:putative phosphoribosyl transferase